MYGVRGANGVIIINTKRGTIAAPSVNVRVEQSIQAPTKLPEFIGAAEYMSLLNSLKVIPINVCLQRSRYLKLIMATTKIYIRMSTDRRHYQRLCNFHSC